MPHLLEPLSVATLTLKNRLVMPPMATAKADDAGYVTEDLLGYYDEKSRDGALGLVITEHCYITKQGQNRRGQPSVADDDMVEGLGRLAALIKGHGSRAVIQVNHAGGAASSAVTGLDVVSASDVPSPVGPGESPRAMTVDELAEVPGQFAAAARRAQAAGFDGVELHAAHGYLLNQFFSPLMNRRTDEYGPSASGRIRLHLEVIAAVRAAVGDDFCVLLRLGACDYADGGSTVEDSVAASVEFERAGVDILDITGGVFGYLRPGHTEPGYFGELSQAVRSAVSIPVILTGGVTEPHHAERLLADGRADLIGVGRAILKDSGWAARALREIGG